MITYWNDKLIISRYRAYNQLADNYCAPLAFSDAGGGERMFETGAVPSQDGTGRGPDGEGLAAAPHEDS